MRLTIDDLERLHAAKQVLKEERQNLAARYKAEGEPSFERCLSPERRVEVLAQMADVNAAKASKYARGAS